MRDGGGAQHKPGIAPRLPSALLSNPRGLLLGAAAQVGIFITFLGALALGFSPQRAAEIGIIGGADGDLRGKPPRASAHRPDCDLGV